MSFGDEALVGREAKAISDGNQRGALRRALEALAILLLSVLLLGALELAARLVRGLKGGPEVTRVARFYGQIQQAVGLYRAHPYLNTGPKAGAAVEAFGKSASFNSLGYRSPERAVERAPGVVRILCAGGSTTFDIAALGDAGTWPWRLESLLAGAADDGHGAQEGQGVEVWNAGFPGWTSLENLISLVQRDLRLEPDVLIFFQGINDLQPAAHQPFDPGYELGHAGVARRALGLELSAMHWSDRSLLLEQLRDWIQGPEDPWSRLKVPTPPGKRAGVLPDEAIQTFRRNVRSVISVAQGHGIRVVLVTQPLRIRTQSRQADLDYLAGWLLGLEPEVAGQELERLNDVLRAMGEQDPGVTVWDAAAAVDWQDRHFADPMHFSASGSELFASALAEQVLSGLLD